MILPMPQPAMPDATDAPQDSDAALAAAAEPQARKRPKPGERRIQILQMLLASASLLRPLRSLSLRR